MLRLIRLVLTLSMLGVVGIATYQVLVTKGTITVGQEITGPVVVELPAGLSRLEMAKAIGGPLKWNDKKAESFGVVYAQMQWAAFNKEYLNILAKEFEWDESRKEIFEINSTYYFTSNLDFSGELYVPGTYTFDSAQSDAVIANALIVKIKETAGDNLEEFIAGKITEANRKKIADFVEAETELRPDLVPLPAKDVVIENGPGGKTLLRFSTIYYNKGRGPLELRADPATVDLRQDVQRDVFQRIYKIDGTYRDKLSGNFLWHQEHLHYHFDDFVTYDLEAVSAKNVPDLSGVLVKSTFCVRDVSLVDIEVENRPKDANYKICGKRMQGISVGWADTYFFTYPDQSLDVTDLPSGTYRLSFLVNPAKFLDEVSLDNNKSSVLIELDMDKKTVKVLEENPKNSPSITHVYEEQVF